MSFTKIAPIVAFLSGLVLTSLIIGLCLPPSADSLVNEKYREFARHKDEVTTLILGTSMSYRQIDPLVLDAQLGARGMPSHSFNFAFDAEEIYEADYYLRALLALHPAKLKNIVIDSISVPPREIFIAWDARSISWRDFRAERLLAANIIEKWAPLSTETMLAKLARQVPQYFYRALNWGRLSAALWPAPIEGSPDSQRLRSDHRGFCAMDWERSATAVTPDAASDAQAPAAPIPPQMKDTDNYLDPFLALAREHGLTVFLANFPRQDGTARVTCAPPACHHLDFRDREKFPELYQPENYFDWRHFNFKGAEIYSRYLAEKMAAP